MRHSCRGSRSGRKCSRAQTFAGGHAYGSHDDVFRLRLVDAPLSPAAALCLLRSRWDAIARRGGRWQIPYLPTFLAAARLRMDAASASAGVRWMRLRGSDASHATSRDLKGSPSCFTHHRQQRHLNVYSTSRAARGAEQRASPPTPTPRARGRATRASQRARRLQRAHDPICLGSYHTTVDVLSLARFTFIHSEPLLTHSKSSRGGKPACAAAPRAVLRAHG